MSVLSPRWIFSCCEMLGGLFSAVCSLPVTSCHKDTQCWPAALILPFRGPGSMVEETTQAAIWAFFLLLRAGGVSVCGSLADRFLVLLPSAHHLLSPSGRFSSLFKVLFLPRNIPVRLSPSPQQFITHHPVAFDPGPSCTQNSGWVLHSSFCKLHRQEGTKATLLLLGDFSLVTCNALILYWILVWVLRNEYWAGSLDLFHPRLAGEKPTFFSWKISWERAWALGSSDLSSSSHDWCVNMGELLFISWTFTSYFAKEEKHLSEVVRRGSVT